jgi:glycosyltransferase involved in cell wall biosynthesis
LTILRPAGADASSTPVRSTTALTVILPCYNEAERLPETLQALLAYLSGIPGQVEVLVVDDGSTDATVMAADAVAAVDRRVRVLSHQPNRGKGFAVRTGMLAAEGELIVFTDADGSYGPSDIDRIVRALGEAPVAIGARTCGTSRQVARRTASRVFNLAIRSSLGLPFGDTQSGLKGFRRAAARQIFNQTRVDGSPSTSRYCGWPASSSWTWPRSLSRRWSVRAAKSGCWPMPWACSGRSGRLGG